MHKSFNTTADNKTNHSTSTAEKYSDDFTTPLTDPLALSQTDLFANVKTVAKRLDFFPCVIDFAYVMFAI
jgi:hypothetical protein